MDKAAKHGHLNVIKFLHEHRSEGSTVRALHDAAYNGNLLMVKFLLEYCNTAVKRAVYMARNGGSLDVLRYLLEDRGGILTAEASVASLVYIHMRVSMWFVRLAQFSTA